jgi:hypothetical protein
MHLALFSRAPNANIWENHHDAVRTLNDVKLDIAKPVYGVVSVRPSEFYFRLSVGE